jgi:hypothetical protein
MKPARIFLVSALLLVCAASCNRHQDETRYKETDGITLDADVPGTEVYLRAERLGTVPVTLSAKELARLGIPNPRTDTNTLLNSDGFGESVFIAGTGKDVDRFTYLVPERMRTNYVPMETPWGIRTRHAGGSFNPQKSFRVYCAKALGRDGLSLKLDPVESVWTNRGPWKYRVTLSNHGAQPIRGFRPSIMICRSFYSPRSTIGPGEVALPKQWASIDPGQSLQTEVTVGPTDVIGDYGIYAIFSLFKDPTNNILIGDGWRYSNTRLLSVR